MKIAYFVNQYPKVSHSFVRREILALEPLGYEIERYALRTNQEELVDPLDIVELSKTQYLLKAPLRQIISAVLKPILTAPLKFARTFTKAVKLGIRSDRGVLLHIIYLVEACILLQWQKQAGTRHIHAHFGTNSTTVVMFAYLLGGTPYSFTVHGPEEFDKPEFIHLAEKIRHCTFVVAISSYGRSQLFRWIPASEWHKVKIIRCGLDATFFEQGYTPPKNKAQLICVGRLCEQKGQLLLLEAVQQLHSEGIHCKLILAGDGPMRQEIEAKIAHYKLNEIVEITGWISSDQVKQLLTDSIALVLPSFAEGLPVVIMEALAMSRPVVSTYVAGIPELVHQGKNGWLVPAGDIESLKKAMKELLTSKPEVLELLGQQGLTDVSIQHHIGKEAKKLADLIAETVRP